MFSSLGSVLSLHQNNTVAWNKLICELVDLSLCLSQACSLTSKYNYFILLNLEKRTERESSSTMDLNTHVFYQIFRCICPHCLVFWPKSYLYICRLVSWLKKAVLTPSAGHYGLQLAHTLYIILSIEEHFDSFPPKECKKISVFHISE